MGEAEFVRQRSEALLPFRQALEREREAQLQQVPRDRLARDGPELTGEVERRAMHDLRDLA